MQTFYVIRHADKESGDFYNSRLRHQDEPISELGKSKAIKLCSAFHDRPVRAIYVSEYQRTWQTIAETASDHGLDPQVDCRLNEMDSGLFEGKSSEEIQQVFPEEWKAFVARKADFRFPQGETASEAQARIAGFLIEKQRQHEAEDIIVVCHDGLIRVMMCYLMGMPVWLRGNFRIDFCGVTEISYQPEYGAWKLARFNQVYG